MAIVNNLQKCMESPYLFEDKDAPGRVPALLNSAADRLEAATNIYSFNKGDKADIIFLAYEAMFACMRALVYSKGLREYGMRCLIIATDVHYVKPGLLDGAMVQKFQKLQELKSKPEEAIEIASAFVKRTLEILTAAQAAKSA
ncbi:MAG: HEPN domain-containing protein [Isosphaeraceae bacterium]